MFKTELKLNQFKTPQIVDFKIGSRPNEQMNVGFAFVAPICWALGQYLRLGIESSVDVVKIAVQESITNVASFSFLNLVEAVLLAVLAFPALSKNGTNSIVSKDAFVNDNLVVAFYLLALVAQSLRVLQQWQPSPTDLVLFVLYLTIALQITQTEGKAVSWILFVLVTYRFQWYLLRQLQFSGLALFNARAIEMM